ncbi:MAG: MOSC domain-containing protein [Sphingomonadaceae bacterium]
MYTRVEALLRGKVTPFARGESSAIDKRIVEGPVRITWLGLEGDEQADPRFHGGPGKALHHYPVDHYMVWAQRAADHPLLRAPGAFGENISTLGLTEDQVCIGDQFRLGSAIVEISQGRQPCWKQGLRMEWTTLPTLMVRERRSGWYYRVIEEGIAQAGDDLTLLDRPLPEWSVRRVFGLLIAGDHKQDPASVRALADMELLDESWRDRAHELTG